MKKFAFLFVVALSLPVFSLTGCGGATNSVVEAPEVDPDAQEMTPEEQAEFDAEMNKSMNQ